MTRYRLLLQQVRTLGRYTCDEEAERVLTVVLAALGSQLTGEERCDLAAALPVPAPSSPRRSRCPGRSPPPPSSKPSPAP
ncbi:DUF2267 domain-containing protein [Kitasatospora sp. NPDC058478]|uniref:DUF2267 domain-containing protein n=1 Tax=unclassified Kitasatospora TaxID=2633591 RepID=UPI00365E7880